MITKQEEILAAQWCINSYNGKHGEVDWSMLAKIVPFAVENTDGYTAEYNSSLVICFKGSSGEADWHDNFDIALTRWEYSGKVHEGFLRQYRRIKNLIYSQAKEYNKIYVCGHSLGGAIATLCGYMLKSMLHDRKIKVITLGSPRVGNRGFVSDYNRKLAGNTCRLVYREDIVTKVPLSWKGLLLYRHVSNKCQIGGRGNMIERIFGRKDDHYPQKYLESLLRA